MSKKPVDSYQNESILREECRLPQDRFSIFHIGTALRGRRQALFPKRAWTKRGRRGDTPLLHFPQALSRYLLPFVGGGHCPPHLSCGHRRPRRGSAIPSRLVGATLVVARIHAGILTFPTTRSTFSTDCHALAGGRGLSWTKFQRYREEKEPHKKGRHPIPAKGRVSPIFLRACA